MGKGKASASIASSSGMLLLREDYREGRGRNSGGT